MAAPSICSYLAGLESRRGVLVLRQRQNDGLLQDGPCAFDTGRYHKLACGRCGERRLRHTRPANAQH